VWVSLTVLVTEPHNVIYDGSTLGPEMVPAFASSAATSASGSALGGGQAPGGAAAVDPLSCGA
jgi:hypothetical protein